MKFKRENKDYSPHNVLGQDLSGVLAADAFWKLSKLWEGWWTGLETFKCDVYI